ncbi:MAG: hypothetical protein IPK80_31560 [Nannocystis sp.]|nr:hypothetical protein [Nannocystis sp.]
MGLLADILDRFAADEPCEVLVATERPLTIVIGSDLRMVAGVVSDDDVYAALGELLTPTQQAELIVARRVEFELTTGAQPWRVIAETATDEIIIRASPQGSQDGLGADEVVVIFPDAWGNEERGEVIEVDIDVGDLEPRGDEAAPPIHLPSARRARARAAALARGRPHEPRSLGVAVERGTICFLHWGIGLGASIGRNIHPSVLVIGEGDAPTSTAAAVESLAEDGVIVVAVEDPSAWLPWILRRAEEGRRILIETRAMTHEGARRVLLGVAASSRAEAWLDGLDVTSAELRDGSWSVVA